MKPESLKETRLMFGMSAEAFAREVRIGDSRTVRRWESGESKIPGSIVRLVEIWTHPKCHPDLKPKTNKIYLDVIES